ncbi:MAG: Crp/Fnr family transcriptional regulator [Verrucomicrobiales bacterium]
MLELLTHLSCALSMGAFLVRDMLWLRALAILSSLVWMVAMLLTDTVIMASMFWNAVFVSINLWQIGSLVHENRSVSFTDEEKQLYDGLFRHFKPGEYSQFLRLGQWQDLAPGAILVEKGRPCDGIWVLSHGLAEVVDEPGELKAALGTHDFVGEMSYLTQEPPSATVRMITDGRALFWKKERLDSFFRLHPTLKIGYQSVITSNLAAKLRR